MPAPDYATEIAALEKAMAAGVLTVEEDGQRVTYQSFRDLESRLNYFKARAAEFASPRTATADYRTFTAVFDRG